MPVKFGSHQLKLTRGDLLRESIARLKNQPRVESPGLEAYILIGAVLGLSRETLFTHPERSVTRKDAERIRALVAERALGVPIAYLIGQRPFYDQMLKVSPAVLIPRPETELIITTALTWAKDQHLTALRAIDVGTGSGAIAVTLAAHLPEFAQNAHVIGVDMSIAALRIAQHNARHLPNIRFVQADLLGALRWQAAIIAANLPYIPTAEWQTLEVSRYEPRLALDGGTDGLDLIRKLLDQAPGILAKPGILLLEHAFDQGSAVQTLVRSAFPSAKIVQLRDDAGLDRVVVVYN